MNSVGFVTLNLSLILYLFFYLPQLIFNFRYKRLGELSFGLHALLFFAATADVFYAFGRIDQWQYRLVSVLMLLSLLVQHVHIFYYRKCFSFGFIKWCALSVFIIIVSCSAFFFVLIVKQPMAIYIVMGWASQVAYWTYGLPQIIKNRNSTHANAISMLFVAIGVAAALLDLMSAWIFSWGAPSLYGGFVAVALQGYLFYQCYSVRDKA
jgi:uncharacterized protein with PQ loop repeat